jgi:hypothetical protein
MQPEIPVAGSRFQQQHPVPPRLGQPVGENAAGAAGAHDDVVELGILHHNASVERIHIERSPARMKSATRSAIISVGMLVLALGTRGITDASATRSPATP